MHKRWRQGRRTLTNKMSLRQRALPMRKTRFKRKNKSFQILSKHMKLIPIPDKIPENSIVCQISAVSGIPPFLELPYNNSSVFRTFFGIGGTLCLGTVWLASGKGAMAIRAVQRESTWFERMQLWIVWIVWIVVIQPEHFFLSPKSYDKQPQHCHGRDTLQKLP